MGLYLCVFRDDATDEEIEGVEVDGEPLVERLIELARTATELRAPIWFQ